MIFGVPRGILVRKYRRYELNTKVNRQHLLRGLYEYLEAHQQLPIGVTDSAPPVSLSALEQLRSWSLPALKKIIRSAQDERLVTLLSDNRVQLTLSGLKEAARVVHEHRLWELYLITYADVASSKVDQDADAIEHVLEPEVIAELESLLVRQSTEGILQSPHDIDLPQSLSAPTFRRTT